MTWELSDIKLVALLEYSDVKPDRVSSDQGRATFLYSDPHVGTVLDMLKEKKVVVNLSDYLDAERRAKVAASSVTKKHQ